MARPESQGDLPGDGLPAADSAFRHIGAVGPVTVDRSARCDPAVPSEEDGAERCIAFVGSLSHHNRNALGTLVQQPVPREVPDVVTICKFARL